jgi:hypothetical protein
MIPEFQFAAAVAQKWGTLATGGILIALIGVYEHRKQKAIPWRLYVWISIFFVLIAAFQAWDDEADQNQKLASDNKGLATQLSGLGATIERLQTDNSDLQSKITALEQKQQSNSQKLAANLGSLVQEGNGIAANFEKSNDTQAIERDYRTWEAKALSFLNDKMGVEYLAQFQSARGNGLALMNHSMEGDGWYALLQGKLGALNAMMLEERSK